MSELIDIFTCFAIRSSCIRWTFAIMVSHTFAAKV